MHPILAANADLAWMLAAFALVLLMCPGLALYYGGMVSARNVLNMMTMVLATVAVASVLYVLYGYGLVSGPSVRGWGLIGNPLGYLGLSDFQTDDGSGGVQGAYQAAWFILFATITVAIVASGAAGRMKFSAWLVFAGIWLTLVYFPVAHWVFAADSGGRRGGFLLNVVKIHDYAGGTAVHMNSGVAALALALALGARQRRFERPHSVPLTLLGGGLLWFGWIGFNGSCAGGATFLAQYVILTTLLAGSTGMIGFCLVEHLREGHVTSLGLITGVIAGLVGITPSANTVSPLGALAVGAITGAVVAFCLSFKGKIKVDDTLDAFAVHGVGGVVGTMCIVLFASKSAPAGVQGVLFGGGFDIAWRELAGILITCSFSFVATYLIAKALDKAIGLRIEEDVEASGLDSAVHAETGYEIPVSVGGRVNGHAVVNSDEPTRLKQRGTAGALSAAD